MTCYVRLGRDRERETKAICCQLTLINRDKWVSPEPMIVLLNISLTLKGVGGSVNTADCSP